MLGQFLGGAGLAVGGIYALLRWVERPLAHIRTGAQRRKLCPPEQGEGCSAQAALAAKDVTVKRQFHTLSNGDKMFYQLIAPSGREPSHVFVYLHGYTSQSDLYLEAMCEMARQGALVVMPDLPCHGRSDGLLCYIPDWWAWVELIWEFMESVVTPLRSASGKPRRVFCSGLSLGGGLTACLGLMRPTFFDGLIPIAPLLCVAEECMPPWIVVTLLRRLVGPFKLTWPVTPSADMDMYDFRVAEQGAAYTKCNPMSMRGCKPRLATAVELGFTFPEWIGQKLKEMRTPFLILHGRSDKVTDPVISERLFNEAASKDKQIKLYDGAFHCELLCCLPGTAKLISKEWLPEQSAQTKQVFDDIGEWVSKRI